MTILILLLMGVFDCEEISAQSRSNFLVKHFYLCPSDGSIKFQGNFSREDDKQYIDFNMSTPFPIDENVGAQCTIDSVMSGRTTVPLFTMREKNFCQAVHKFMGEFSYDIERGVQLPPGVCPIPAGRYRAHHVLVDFNKLTLQTFPFGTLRFTMNIINKKTDRVALCYILEVENTL